MCCDAFQIDDECWPSSTFNLLACDMSFSSITFVTCTPKIKWHELH